MSLISDTLNLFLRKDLLPFPSLPLPSLSIFNIFFIALEGNFTFWWDDFLALGKTEGKDIILKRKQQEDEEN